MYSIKSGLYIHIIFTTAIIIIISLTTAIAYKRCKKPAAQDYQNAEMNNYGEDVVQRILFKSEKNLVKMEMEDDQSIGRPSSTPQHNVYKNKGDKTHSSTRVIPHKQARHPKTATSFIPEPRDFIPEPPPFPPPIHPPSSKSAQPPKPPPKVFPPGSSLMQLANETEPHNENAAVSASVPAEGKSNKKMNKKDQSTGKFASLSSALMHQSKCTDVHSSTATNQKEAITPPKPPPELPPKLPLVSSSILPPKPSFNSKNLTCHNHVGTAYSTTVVSHTKVTFQELPPEIPPKGAQHSASLQPFKLLSTFNALISHNKGGKAHSSTEVSPQEGVVPKPPIELAPDPLPDASSMELRKPKPSTPSKVKAKTKPDPPPKVFGPNSSWSPAASESCQQDQTATIAKSSFNDTKMLLKEGDKDANSISKPTSAFYSPLYQSSAGDLHSSTSTPHKREIFPKPKPKLLPKLPLDVPTGEVPKQDCFANATGSSSKNAFKSPLYNRSAGELHLSAPVSGKQALLPKTKSKTLPNYSLVPESSFAQSASKRYKKDRSVTNTTRSSPAGAKMAEKQVLKGSSSTSNLSNGFQCDPQKKSGGESCSNTFTSRKPVMFSKKKANLPPKPTPNSTPKQPPRPPPKVFPSTPSLLPASSTQIHPQAQNVVEIYDDSFSLPITPNQQPPEDQNVVEIYDDPLSLPITSNQQPPHLKRNGFPPVNSFSHAYEEFDNSVPSKKAPLTYHEKIPN